MPKATKDPDAYRYIWSSKQIDLIRLVKEYKVFDMDKKDPFTQRIWNQIAGELGISAYRCRRMWCSINITYKRLNILVKDGIMSESKVRNHYKVKKYFDGSLDFLDPWLINATPVEIAKIRRHETSTKTISQLLGFDIRKEQKIPDKKLVPDKTNLIKDLSKFILHNVKNVQENSRDIIVSDEQNTNKKNAKKIENKIKVNQLIKPEDSVEEKSDRGVTEDLASFLVRHSFPNPRKLTVRADLATFLVRHSFPDPRKVTYSLNNYMDDLANAICSVLPPTQRIPLMKEIDAIASEFMQK